MSETFDKKVQLPIRCLIFFLQPETIILLQKAEFFSLPIKTPPILIGKERLLASGSHPDLPSLAMCFSWKTGKYLYFPHIADG